MDYVALSLTASAILLVFYLYRHQLFQKGGQCPSIPGPKPANASEGNFPDIARSGGFNRFLQDIHQKYGPISSFWWGPELMVSVASPELFKHQAKLFNRPSQLFELMKPLLGYNGVNYINGEEGKRRHKAYAACFGTQNIQQYYSILHKLSDDLLEKWRRLPSGEHISAQEHLVYFSVKAALQSVMGAFFKDEEKSADLWHSSAYMWDEVQKRLRGDNADQDSERMDMFNKHRTNIRNIIKDAWTYRLNNPAGEGEHQVIDAIMEQDMADDVRIDDMTNMFFGASHTTGFAMVWAVYFLGSNPHVQEKAYKEITQILGNKKMDHESYKEMVYMDQVIMETIRWSTAVPFSVRYRDTDCEVAGYNIPAGTPIVHAIGVVDKDPSIFPDPDIFDPERFSPENSKHLPSLAFEPFGFAGKRKCPGYRFAVLQAVITLVKILKEFKISLVEGQVVTPVDGLITEPAEDIWFTIEKRQ